MKKRKLVLTVIGVIIFSVVIMVYTRFSRSVESETKATQQTIQATQATDKETEDKETNVSGDELENVTSGSEKYRGFIMNNVLHSPSEGDIHYNVYIPDSNFAHRFSLCTLKIQYLAVIQLSKFIIMQHKVVFSAKAGVHS